MFEVIKEVLSEQLGVEADIKLESKLREDLNIDSLLAVQLSVLLENKYDIDITEEELGKLVTIKDVIDLLETKGVKA
jgi:acyl carrier protein